MKLEDCTTREIKDFLESRPYMAYRERLEARLKRVKSLKDISTMEQLWHAKGALEELESALGVLDILLVDRGESEHA